MRPSAKHSLTTLTGDAPDGPLLGKSRLGPRSLDTDGAYCSLRSGKGTTTKLQCSEGTTRFVVAQSALI